MKIVLILLIRCTVKELVFQQIPIADFVKNIIAKNVTLHKGEGVATCDKRGVATWDKIHLT